MVNVSTRVDECCALRLRANDERAVLLKRRDRNDLDLHSRIIPEKEGRSATRP